MDQLISNNLIGLFAPHSEKNIAGILAISKHFILHKKVSRKQCIWTPGVLLPNLYFNGEGILAEYANIYGKLICINFIKPFTLFWSDASFLLWKDTDTTIRALTPSTIYQLEGPRLEKLTLEHGMGYQMANALTTKTILNFRQRSAELCSILGAKDRLKLAFDKDPAILSHISRADLAGYMNLTRSTLFRALKEFYHA
ncbi:MAG: hypothetical protein ABR87_05925 [Cryomorphaceae bacterium BACL7 MAG-121220-bin83]|nr:MAG: hypothetical protein ABR87_05925 [Cryomorphaceae bacterium BACL7 MAG-121220-bin83]